MKTTVVNLKESDYDIYIGRPSPWGNPYVVGRDGTREQVIQMFRELLELKPCLVEQARKYLKGKRLGCFCKPLPCHGDVWAEILDA